MAMDDVGDQLSVAVEHNQIEEPLRVLGERRGMRTAEHRTHTALAIQPSKCVGQRAGLRVSCDENDVEIVGQEVDRIAFAVVGSVMNPTSQLPAPHGNRLRHDRDELLAEIRSVYPPEKAS